MALWTTMQEGVFDTIGSDHAPKDKKVEDDFFGSGLWIAGGGDDAAGGLALWCKPGSDADVVVFDPKDSWTVSTSNQHSNASYTMFEGQELLGRVKKVLSRGCECQKRFFFGIQALTGARKKSIPLSR